MRFDIRRAKIGDEHVLRSLRLQALTDSPRAFSSSYERELARTTQDWQRWLAPGATFFLEVGGEPGGLVACVRDAEESSVVHLMAMWVHPLLRGAGAAQRLISAVKYWTFKIGATQVRLNVVEDNLPAKRCYERSGFRATGRQGIVERTGDVEIEMVCQLIPLGYQPGNSE